MWFGRSEFLSKLDDKVSKQSTESGTRQVNQLRVAPFRDVGNTLQKITSSEV